MCHQDFPRSPVTFREALDSMPYSLVATSDIVTWARILELGSGIGLLGLLVATLQKLARSSYNHSQNGSCIYLTDVDDDVLARCSSNLRLPCS